jgi:TRAP transporter 4TM/12TM fusion protein
MYTTPEDKKDKKLKTFDIICASLSLVIGLYIVLNGERWAFRRVFLDPLTLGDKILGIIMVLLVLEAVRRVVGYPLLVLSILFLIYPFIGKFIPGLFGHRGFAFNKVLEMAFMTTNGVFGMPVGISSTYVFMFSLFGEVLNASGAGDIFFDLARSIAGFTRGGLAKTAVVASALFGSISGSPISNVATTGSFTIPMMKKSGYPAHFAGAVETAASCGGTIAPPVMGAVAFIVAEIMGVTYAKIMIVAFIPAILYFGSVFLGVDSAALKLNLKGVPRRELPSFGKTLIRGLRFIIPLGWLVFRILAGYTANRAAFESTLLLIVFSFFTKDRTQWMNLNKILKALEDSVKTVLTIAIACAAAGIIVGMISLTGVGAKFTSLVLALAHGQLFLALILTMIVTIILGMGMNITPTYILAASLAAPALIKAGVVPMAAHFFIMYFAAMATMTPPVAMAAYTAASIADSDPMKVGFTAVRLGIVAYIIPFVFIYRPELLLHGESAKIIITSLFIFAGCYSLACGLNGWLFKPTKNYERIILLAAALLMFWPSYLINAIGAAILGVTMLMQYSRRDNLRDEIKVAV